MNSFSSCATTGFGACPKPLVSRSKNGPSGTGSGFYTLASPREGIAPRVRLAGF